MNVLDFAKMKAERRKISMATCYDAWSAKLLAKSKVDTLLVGDSLAMVVHGFTSTLSATVEMMSLHTEAVARGAGDKFIVADMPFLSVRAGLEPAMQAVGKLMRAGAHAVKIENVAGHDSIIGNIVESGVPIMGHLGLTPQSVNEFGGFKVQGKDLESRKRLVADARRLEELGAFAVVLECIPDSLAREVTDQVGIPTIGIGAGSACDGQVLVLQDLLGMNLEFKPKFLRTFLKGAESVIAALDAYDRAVKEGQFPNAEESYHA